jgi:hypothetical protein
MQAPGCRAAAGHSLLERLRPLFERGVTGKRFDREQFGQVCRREGCRARVVRKECGLIGPDVLTTLVANIAFGIGAAIFFERPPIARRGIGGRKGSRRLIGRSQSANDDNPDRRYSVSAKHAVSVSAAYFTFAT